MRANQGANAIILDHIEVHDSECGAQAAIHLAGSQVVLRDSELHHNQRVLWATSAVLKVERTTFHSNISLPNIVMTTDSDATFINSTFSGNYKPLTARNSDLTLIGNTFTNSEVEHVAIKTDNPGQVFYVANSLMSGAAEPSCLYYTTNDVSVDIAGTVDVSGSVFDDASCVPNNNAPAVPNIYNALIELSPLADHGGPTSTHELLPDSDGIDWIPPQFCTANGTDQRGYPRAVSYSGVNPAHCDAGATELQITKPPTQVDIFSDSFESS